jgi:hypothetical protein
MGEVTFHPQVFESLLGSGTPGGRAVPVANSATGSTGSVVATLAAAANRLTHIRSFHYGSLGTTGALITVTGLPAAIGTLNFEVPAAAAFGFTFDPPLPASGQNTAIVVTAAANASATAVAVTAVGFQA